MEPLSARGLPRLSWIDTLYSSMYPSVPLFTPRRTSLPIYLRSTLMPFYPATPPPFSSTSHGLPVCVTTTLILPPLLQLVGITVAVHNKTVNPDTLHTQSCPPPPYPVVAFTLVRCCCCWGFSLFIFPAG